MSWTRDRAQVAALSRSRSADDPELVAARRRLAQHTLDDHIARVVANAPALTAEQRDRLAALLRRPAPRERPPLEAAP